MIKFFIGNGMAYGKTRSNERSIGYYTQSKDKNTVLFAQRNRRQQSSSYIGFISNNFNNLFNMSTTSVWIKRDVDKVGVNNSRYYL